MELTSREVFNRLISQGVIGKKGFIAFDLANVKVIIKTTDIVGNSIQSWLEQWFIDNGVYYSDPENTQAFPDFYLSSSEKEKHMLEVKAFNFEATPAFDIANYESYVESVANKPWRLDADYIVFGYKMAQNGEISIERIWLKKIWELAGVSKKWALRVQDKRNVIYNIRPNSNFKFDTKGPFNNDVDFLKAIYDTQFAYRGKEKANEWLNKIKENYKKYYSRELNIDAR